MVVSPGQPPPGLQQQPGGGFGAPPPSGPTPPPPKKSKLPLILGIGCGCVLVLVIAGAVGAYLFYRALAPGEEIATTDVQPGQPFTVTYTQDGDQQYEVWMDVDVSYTNGLQLNGPINISVNNELRGQYNLEMTGSGSPIRERSSSKNVNWVTTNLGGNGSASGKTFLFPLPAYDDGATITLSGTVTASQGLVARRLRILVTD